MGAPSGAKGELHLLALSLFCRGYCCRNLRSASWLSTIRFRLWPRARLTAWLGCSPRWRRGGRWSSRRTSNACRESACRLQIAAHVIEVVRRLAGGVPYHGRPGDAVPERCSHAAAHGRSACGRRGTSGAAVLPLGYGSACADAFCRRWIGRGEPHAYTDEVLNDARTLMQKLALVLLS